MNRDEKDILSDIGNTPAADDTTNEEDVLLIEKLFSDETEDTDQGNDILDKEDDILIDELFSSKNNTEEKKSPAPPTVTVRRRPRQDISLKKSKGNAKNAENSQLRKDARYSMTEAEIETLASAAEDAVADGRYGAALDSVFFTAGEAREALRERLNIRIPLGSDDSDLPVIAAAALIDSYLEHEDIDNKSIEEKLRLIIESSEDEHGVRPTAEQVNFKIFECALILCVQAEQCGKHPEIKKCLYGDEDSFLKTYLDRNIDPIMSHHRKDLQTFVASVKLQSRAVSDILEEYMANSKYSAPFIVKFFAESTPVLVTSVIFGVLCLASIILYIMTYGNLISFVASNDKPFLMIMLIILEVLFCTGLVGVSWLVYTSGEDKEKQTK